MSATWITVVRLRENLRLTRRLFRIWLETVTRYRGLVAEKHRADDRQTVAVSGLKGLYPRLRQLLNQCLASLESSSVRLRGLYLQCMSSTCIWESCSAQHFSAVTLPY